MGLEEQLRGRLSETLEALASSGALDPAVARDARFMVEAPRKGGSGDLATNVALALAKPAGQQPRALAEKIAEGLRRAPEVREVEIAGPGFLNLSLHPAAFHRVLADVLQHGAGYGHAPSASGERVMVEFVSANPTGPLLISHGRGAVVGDAVARLLEATGHRVTREYYINDYGNQVRLLGDSVIAAHHKLPPPPGGYAGFFVDELVAHLAAHHPELLEPITPDGGGPAAASGELVRRCITLMMLGVPGTGTAGIRPNLARLGIEFDVFTSEEGLHRWGRVERTLDELAARGRVRTQDDGSVVFVTGDEDDKDRVVKKRDGATTYFASDIAYHDDKYARGFSRLIDVWGADHHGYIARMKSAIEATGRDASRFEVLLFQLVKLVRDGQEVRMGKRLGTLITLQEVMDEIDEAVGNPHAGRDALRFFFLSRKSDTTIVLDVELAKKQESENPVFYVQYGHARLCAIARRAQQKFGLDLPRFDDRLAARVSHPRELALLAQLGRWPALVAACAAERDPHGIVAYLQDVAQEFQSYYTELKQQGDSILPRARDLGEGWESRWDRDKTLGRLLWVDAIRTVYASGLALLGLSAPERMSRAEDDEEAASPN